MEPRMTVLLCAIAIMITISPTVAPDGEPVMFFAFESPDKVMNLFMYLIRMQKALPVYENYEYFLKNNLLGRSLLEILDDPVSATNNRFSEPTGYYAFGIDDTGKVVDYSVPRSLVALAMSIKVFPYVYDLTIKDNVYRHGYRFGFVDPSDESVNYKYNIMNFEWKANTPDYFRPVKLPSWNEDALNTIGRIASADRWETPSMVLRAQASVPSSIRSSVVERLSIISTTPLQPHQIASPPIDPRSNIGSPMSQVNLELPDADQPPPPGSILARSSKSSLSSASSRRTVTQRGIGSPETAPMRSPSHRSMSSDQMSARLVPLPPSDNGSITSSLKSLQFTNQDAIPPAHRTKSPPPKMVPPPQEVLFHPGPGFRQSFSSLGSQNPAQGDGSVSSKRSSRRGTKAE
ncbi:hypothetical protein DdX_08425 [Ditylenchus destructor]|uniref:Uncharacterized protein n=1 Tax=Ditylenchus destructor TaxID=166010 RepID=A0AAD4N3A6_9BILA|nr:hypothetical protein DdX_08425 [Ditylenchus destructor]